MSPLSLSSLSVISMRLSHSILLFIISFYEIKVKERSVSFLSIHINDIVTHTSNEDFFVQEFLLSIAFLDNKRPYTVKLLSRLIYHFNYIIKRHKDLCLFIFIYISFKNAAFISNNFYGTNGFPYMENILFPSK